jgi:MFS superfamily sulfate permease-like transporter
MPSHDTAHDCKQIPAVAGWNQGFREKVDIMPRPSTIVILLSTVALVALGFAAAVPAGIALALTFELAASKREADRERALRPVRVARPLRRRR